MLWFRFLEWCQQLGLGKKIWNTGNWCCTPTIHFIQYCHCNILPCLKLTLTEWYVSIATLSLVSVWICFARSVHTSEAKLFFDLWNPVRLLIQCKVPCNNHGLFLHNDYVLNKCTFYLSQASAPLAFPPSDHTCILYIELFIIKRLYINISINILYVQMRGRQMDFYISTHEIEPEHIFKLEIPKANGQNIKA